ncbi:MAG: flagellar basal body rod C-terminal domain-containing protein [bacterium]
MRIMLDNALSGVKAHQQRLEVESHNLANVNTPGFKASRATLAESSIIPGALETSNVDLVDNMVGMIVNERGVQANTATIKTADRIAGEIIDLVK